jgi:hypothetical protein
MVHLVDMHELCRAEPPHIHLLIDYAVAACHASSLVLQQAGMHSTFAQTERQPVATIAAVILMCVQLGFAVQQFRFVPANAAPQQRSVPTRRRPPLSAAPHLRYAMSKLDRAPVALLAAYASVALSVAPPALSADQCAALLGR